MPAKGEASQNDCYVRFWGCEANYIQFSGVLWLLNITPDRKKDMEIKQNLEQSLQWKCINNIVGEPNKNNGILSEYL